MGPSRPNGHDRVALLEALGLDFDEVAVAQAGLHGRLHLLVAINHIDDPFVVRLHHAFARDGESIVQLLGRPLRPAGVFRFRSLFLFSGPIWFPALVRRSLSSGLAAAAIFL